MKILPSNVGLQVTSRNQPRHPWLVPRGQGQSPRLLVSRVPTGAIVCLGIVVETWDPRSTSEDGSAGAYAAAVAVAGVGGVGVVNVDTADGGDRTGGIVRHAVAVSAVVAATVKAQGWWGYEIIEMSGTLARARSKSSRHVGSCRGARCYTLSKHFEPS